MQGAGASGGKAEQDKIGTEGVGVILAAKYRGSERAGNHRFGRQTKQTKRGGCSCQMANQCK